MDVFLHCDDLVDQFVCKCEELDIKVSPDAIELMKKFFRVQIPGGTISSVELLKSLVDSIDLDDVVALYRIKYSGLPISFNRAIRLLSDLHEPWIANKHAMLGAALK